MIKLLAISGSLRAASLNTMLLRALTRVAPEDISVVIYAGMADLPLFNPDLETDDPLPVADFRNRVIQADGVIIASPEYAHGIPGVMKNALDWVVGSEAFVNKPVMLLNASPRATLAQAALHEVLNVMSACIVEEACIAVQILGSGLDEAGIVNHPEISLVLKQALLVFQRAIRRQQTACFNGSL
ncbi:MAG: NADPH-dependent FMN reductase [Steroidobacteraceae bacterium]